MAKSKVENKPVTPAPQQSVNCSICQESIGLNDYARHIQERHSSPAPGPAIPRAVIPNTPIPSMPFPGSPFQPQNGPQPQVRPMTGPIRGDDYAGTQYLKGVDLPTGTNEVRVRVIQFVYIPGQRSPLACQIDKVYGKEYLGINKTNIKQLMTLGFPDLSVLAGKTLVLATYPTNTPDGKMTIGLWVRSVEG